MFSLHFIEILHGIWNCMQNIETIQWICPLYKDFRFWLFLSLKLSRALSFPLKTHGYVFHPQHYIQHSGPIICHHHLQMTKILGSLLCNPIAHCINNLLAIIGVLWPFGDLWWFPAQCVACSLTVWPGWPIQLVPKNDHLCAGLLHCWGSNTYNCIAIISMSSCKKDINKFCPILWNDKFSIFMPPPLGAGGIMFFGLSGRPSVRRLKYRVSTPTWVRWSTQETVTIFRHVRPSVRPSIRPERFPGICRRTHGGNGLKCCMLMYPDHHQNWLDYGHGLLNFLFLALFWLSETGQILGFRAFTGERIKGMAWNVVCWCILTTFRTD